jgi:hypothetical protein
MISSFSNTRYHLSRLHCLMRHWSGKTFCLQDSIKSHNMTDHYPAQVKALGHSIKAHGCEIGERSHKDFVHEPFIQTSRRRKEMLMEMMLVQKRKNIALILKRSIDEPSVTAKTDDVNNDKNQIRLSSLLIRLQDGVYKLLQREKKKLRTVDSIIEHMHYKLNPDKLAKLLKEHWGTDYFCLEDYQCWIRKGIRMTSPEGTTFVVKANPKRIFNRYETSNNIQCEFSFVRCRVMGNDGFEMRLCKVMAIVEVVTVRVDFVLCVMDFCDNLHDWDIPFHMYKLSENIITSTLDNISCSPVCVIPQLLTDNTIFELDTVGECEFYFEIPSSRITKSTPMSYDSLRSFCSDNLLDEDRCFSSEETINAWAYKLEEMHNSIIKDKNKLRLEREKAEYNEKMTKRQRY